MADRECQEVIGYVFLVIVGDELISSIGQGICVLVGISRDDTKQDMEYIVRKILNLRVFDDEKEKRWTKSVMDKNFEILCVSQFTLYATMKGNKPDYHLSMAADQSQDFYREFLTQMQAAYSPEKIKDGAFGAMMQVHIQNDGPVTITLESPAKQDNAKGKVKTKNASKSSSSAGTPSSSAAETESLATEVKDACQISTDTDNTLDK